MTHNNSQRDDAPRRPADDDREQLAKLMLVLLFGHGAERDAAASVLREQLDPCLRRWIGRMCGYLKSYEIDEVVQLVWQAVLRYRSYDGTRPLKPWLRSVTRSAVRLERQDREHGTKFVAGKRAELDAIADDHRSACDDIDARDSFLRQAKKMRSCTNLTPRCREALECILEHFEQGGDEDSLVPHVKNALGVSDSYARVLLHRVSKQLDGDVQP